MNEMKVILWWPILLKRVVSQIQRETAYEGGRIERSYKDWKDVEHDMNEVEKKKLEWGQGWVKLKIS